MLNGLSSLELVVQPGPQHDVLPMTHADAMQPVLVTGATGFIGRRLIHRFVTEGFPVVAFVQRDRQVPTSWSTGVRIERGDITDHHSIEQAMKGCRAVVHLAALVTDWGSAQEHQRVTVNGTENVLLEACRQKTRALLASSIAVYGDRLGKGACTEQTPHGEPCGPYSASKQAQERIALRLEADEGLRVTIIRPANVYGPASPNWVQAPIAQLKRGRPCLIGRGQQCAGLTYVDNVADLFFRATCRKETVGRTYNAADGLDVSWRRYFSDLAQLCGAPRPRRLPRWAARGAAQVLERSFRALGREQRPDITREALNLVGSNVLIPIDKARRELGYHPKVDYPEAMAAIAKEWRHSNLTSKDDP